MPLAEGPFGPPRRAAPETGAGRIAKTTISTAAELIATMAACPRHDSEDPSTAQAYRRAGDADRLACTARPCDHLTAADPAGDSWPPESVSGDNDSRSRQVSIERLVVVGYILGVAMPPLGFVIGLVLMLSRRVRSKHGVWIVLVSIVAAVIWALLIGSGALTTTNQGY